MHAIERMRGIRTNEQKRALRWYGVTLPEYRRETTRSQQSHRDGCPPVEVCLDDGSAGRMQTNGNERQQHRTYNIGLARDAPGGAGRAQGGRGKCISCQGSADVAGGCPIASLPGKPGNGVTSVGTLDIGHQPSHRHDKQRGPRAAGDTPRANTTPVVPTRKTEESRKKRGEAL